MAGKTMKMPEEIKKGLGCRILGSAEKCDHKCSTCQLYVPGYLYPEIYKDALALINQLEAQVPKWISVEERLPECKAIAGNFTPDTYGYGEMIIGYVSAVKAFAEDWEPGLYVAENDSEILRHVSHWMPLPEPPKE